MNQSTHLPRFRFGLRTMLVVCLLLAIAAAWFGLELRAQQRQRAAVHAIAVKGGVVWYDLAEFFTEVEFQMTIDKGCGQTVSLNPVVKSEAAFTEADLPLLAHLRRLRNIDFTGSQVSTAAIEDFRRSHPSLTVKP